MKSRGRDHAEGAFHKATGNFKLFAGELFENCTVLTADLTEKKAGSIYGRIGQINEITVK
jgi:hypothetical protein